MLDWKALGLHLPIVGMIPFAIALTQVLTGRAYFGFPGDGPIEKKSRPISYWFIVLSFTLMGAVFSFLELKYY